MINWFGKKEATDIVKGVGGWIDEQQFTKEEQVKYKMHLLEKMEPFKIVQRIIVTWVMYVWAMFAVILAFSWGLGVLINDWTPLNKVVEIVMTEFVWIPCLGVFTFYLSGGLKLFKGGK